MFDVKFKIERKGCWTYYLSKHFKGRFISHITFRLNKDTTSDILHINQKDDSQFLSIIKFLKRHKIVYKLDFMYQDNNNLYLQIYSNVSKIRSLIGTINNHGAFLLKPIILQDGCEICTITIPNKKGLELLLEDIKKCGKFELLSIKKSSLDNSNLSEKQQKAINLAFKLGYYEFPRKISAKELAKHLSISKSTLLQHLRIAEIKILKNNYLL